MFTNKEARNSVVAVVMIDVWLNRMTKLLQYIHHFQNEKDLFRVRKKNAKSMEME